MLGKLRERFLKRGIYILIFAGPLVLALLFLFVYPFFSAIQTSFVKHSIKDMSEAFNGLANYREVFADPRFLPILGNTIVFSVFSILIATVLAFVAALLLNTNMRFKGFIRAVNIIPWVAPPLTVSLVWRWIFHSQYSPINDILLRLNIIDEPLVWLGNTSTGLPPFFTFPMLIIIIIYVWRIYPFLMLVLLSGLQSIPEELYEAAEVDGATFRQKVFSITIPMLKPVLVVSLTIVFIWTFQYFNISYLVTGGGPRGYTEVLATHIYNLSFLKYNYSAGAVVGVLMMLILIIPSFYFINSTLKQMRELK